MDAICVLFILSAQLRLSSASVEFDFSVSLNDVAPVSPILLSVDLMRIEKSGSLMNVIYVLFLLYSPPILSFVSAVFVFNASLNDVAPVSPILLSVDFLRIEKKISVDRYHLDVVSFVFTT